MCRILIPVGVSITRLSFCSQTKQKQKIGSGAQLPEGGCWNCWIFPLSRQTLRFSWGDAARQGYCYWITRTGQEAVGIQSGHRLALLLHTPGSACRCLRLVSRRYSGYRPGAMVVVICCPHLMMKVLSAHNPYIVFRLLTNPVVHEAHTTLPTFT
jgi:hypothetical protein